MSKILSTCIAMAPLLFAACGTPTADEAALFSEETQLRQSSSCQGANCPTVLQPGEPCGGLIGGRTNCGEGAYCAYTVAEQCGSGDQQGVCTPWPAQCPHGIRYDPVCGCDSQTYDGGCNAAAAGTSVQRVGACDQNVTGDWMYARGSTYRYTFDPDGTFTSTVQPDCAVTEPSCASRVMQSAGVYRLYGQILSLAYTSASRNGATAQFYILATGDVTNLKGSDYDRNIYLARTR